MAEYERKKRDEAAKLMSTDDDGYVPAFFSSGNAIIKEKEKETMKE